MSGEHNPRPIADLATAADLGDGQTIAWCVYPRGVAWPWLIDTTVESSTTPFAVPDHENAGPLPQHWQELVSRTTNR